MSIVFKVGIMLLFEIKLLDLRKDPLKRDDESSPTTQLHIKDDEDLYFVLWTYFQIWV